MISVNTITVVSSIVGTGVAFGAVVWGISRYNVGKRAEIYQRIDNTRTDLREDIDKKRESLYEDCRSQDVCDERHEGLQKQMKGFHEALIEVGKDIKTILRNGSA